MSLMSPFLEHCILYITYVTILFISLQIITCIVNLMIQDHVDNFNKHSII